MADLTVNFVDEPLKVLLKAAKDYPNSHLDLSVAYISAIGVSWLQPLLKSAKRVRAVVGLCPINRVNAFAELQDYGVDVYVYMPERGKIFHPKIYYGTTQANAWAMVGSSNLTQKGLSINIERNLFIAGQRLSEPFASIESQLETFRSQAYPFDKMMRKKLTDIEKDIMKKKKGVSDDEYLQLLINAGIHPKTSTGNVIPTEVQQIAVDTIFEFARTTRLEYAYQMLLLLILLYRTDKNGQILLEEAAHCFMRFYKLRQDAGLPIEKRKQGLRGAAVENALLKLRKMSNIIKVDPFPRFERRGLLDISADERYFIVNPALIEGLQPALREELRSIAVQRMAEHFEEDRSMLDAMVTIAIG